MRRYVGEQAYVIEVLAGVVADDNTDADGVGVLSFAQAQRTVLALKPRPEAGALTVAGAIRQYLDYLAAHGKATLDDSTKRANALILPPLGGIVIEALSTEQIRAWHAGLVGRPAGIPESRCGRGTAAATQHR